MARRVLSVALSVAAAIAVAASGCRDWASFEDVPAPAATTAGGGTNGPDGGAPDTGSPPIATDSALFAQLDEKPTLLSADAQGIVFLTTAGSILTCPHEGCALPGVIASGQREVKSLATGFGYVVWIARADQVVRRAPRTPGKGPSEQVKEPNGLVAVAFTPTQLYFSVDGANDLIRGDGIRTCTPGPDCDRPSSQFDGFSDGPASEMRFDGADAFWLADDGVYGCAIAACNKDSAKRIAIAKDPLLPNAITVDADHAYYGSTLDGGSIRSFPRSVLAGGAIPPPKAIATKLGAPTRIVATSASVWYVDPVGVVGRVPRAGGAPVVVAKGLADPTGIAVAGGWVYVTCAGDGRIFRWREQ